jgi:hypothetical protein
VTYDDARPVLRAVTENVMLEIQKTFDFFKATGRSDKIDRIMLSGGASRAEASPTCCGSLRGPVERSIPSRNRFDAKKFKTESAADIAPTVARRGRAGPPPGGGPMIRINLLAVRPRAGDRRRARSVPRSAPRSASPSARR